MSEQEKTKEEYYSEITEKLEAVGFTKTDEEDTFGRTKLAVVNPETRGAQYPILAFNIRYNTEQNNPANTVKEIFLVTFENDYVVLHSHERLNRGKLRILLENFDSIEHVSNPTSAAFIYKRMTV